MQVINSKRGGAKLAKGRLPSRCDVKAATFIHSVLILGIRLIHGGENSRGGRKIVEPPFRDPREQGRADRNQIVIKTVGRVM